MVSPPPNRGERKDSHANTSIRNVDFDGDEGNMDFQLSDEVKLTVVRRTHRSYLDGRVAFLNAKLAFAGRGTWYMEKLRGVVVANDPGKIVGGYVPKSHYEQGIMLHEMLATQQTLGPPHHFITLSPVDHASALATLMISPMDMAMLLFGVRRKRVIDALRWLQQHHPAYVIPPPRPSRS
jgi:hypothetical protein